MMQTTIAVRGSRKRRFRADLWLLGMLHVCVGCSPQNVVRTRAMDAGGQVEWENGQVVAMDLSDVESPEQVLRGLPQISTVRRLSLRNNATTAAALEAIPDWPLEWLDLGGAAIEEAPLDRFPALQWLSLSETQVRDHSSLLGLHQLRTLALSPLADDDALRLAGSWPELRTLHASRTQIRGGLVALTPRVVPNLRTLYLAETALDDAAFQRLPIHPRLERVVLRETTVGDATAARLASFPRLDYIDLSKTRVTDEGLLALTTLKDLYVLDVDGSLVTKAGLAAFAKSRPEIQVAHRLLTPPRTPEDEDMRWLHRDHSEDPG